jgi:hypothetical protein
VDTSEYSAKEYAIGTTVAVGSAKDWAVLPEDSAVTGSSYSSLHHAAKAAASATAAASSASGGSGSATAAAASATASAASETAAAASETAANASADAVSVLYDAFNDTYLGAMADGASQGTNPTPTGTWAKNSSTITVSAGTNIKVGQVVTGTGMPTSPKPNVISIAGTTVVLSDNMAAAGSGVTLTFTGYGIYGDFNGGKDGPALNNDGDALADGMLYFNTTDDVVKVYDETTSTWKQIQPTSAEQTNINTLAAISGNVTTVAGISGNVTTVAGISANTTTVAGISANVTTVAGMSANVSTVAGVAANVTTVATNIANVNTTATNIAHVNNFADVYQIHSFSPSAPTTDGGGNAVAEGDLAFDTTANVMKAYTGAEWIIATISGVVPAAGGTFTGAVTFESAVTHEVAPVFDGGLKNRASQNLTGTITDAAYLSLAYILTGDITLSGNNVLGKVAGGTNVSITNDGSTRTISGSGTLLVNSAMFN